MAKALITNGKIETTRAKAKAVVPEVEKMVTLAKKGDINARRKVFSMLDNSKKATSFLFDNIAKAFLNRKSGFVRMTSLMNRSGDNAKMVRLEWTEKVTTEDIKNEDKKDKSNKVTKTAKKPSKSKKELSLKPSNPKS